MLIARLGTRAGRCYEDGGDHTIRRPLQQVPNERASNAEADDHEPVYAQMIHQPNMVVRIRVPRAVNLKGSNGPTARGVAEVRCDATILLLKFTDSVEDVREVRNCRVQSTAGYEQQWCARPAFHVVDAHRTTLIDRHDDSLIPVHHGACAPYCRISTGSISTVDYCT